MDTHIQNFTNLTVDLIHYASQDVKENYSDYEIPSNHNVLSTHLALFGANKKYDVKVAILKKHGEKIILCGNGVCNYVDYSTVGNILFGYISAQREISKGILWLASGYLETSDRLLQGKDILWENWPSYLDDPGDKAAVDFGINLFDPEFFGTTVEKFQMALTPNILNSFQSSTKINNKSQISLNNNLNFMDYIIIE
mgnify:CR=1 FL=1